MPRDEYISKFLQQNLTALTATNLTLAKSKEIEKKFFTQEHYRLHYSRPTHRELLPALLKLLTKRGIDQSELLTFLHELPIFSFAGDTFRETLVESLTGHESALNADQLQQIKLVGSYEAAKQNIAQDFKADQVEELTQLQQEIDKKRLEYESLPSVLDQNELDEPEFNPVSEDIRPWWERFYLKADPFQRKDGLSDIDESLYDQVLVKTKPFEDTISALSRSHASLFNKATLLVGDYGFGKTTYIDYISYYLVNLQILPIRLTCGRQFSDSAGFLNAFYLKLRTELERETDRLSLDGCKYIQDTELEEQVKALASQICATKRKGILIFLDDYHKHRSHFNQIFEFLGLLQILKDALARSGVPVGFIVSGTPDWKTALERNGQMAGFLDGTPIELPSPTPELVAHVFNQRLQAYCFDQSPRTIQVDFVKRMFRDITGQAGYRDYLSKIISELANNNMAIINSPIDISQETLAKLRLIIERDPALKKSFNKLIYESKIKRYVHEQVRLCLELLVTTFAQDGISEQDQLFVDKKYYFQLLRDVSLIQKQKSKQGSGLRWVPIYRLRIAVEEIWENYHLNPTDYILKVYGGAESNVTSRIIDLEMPQIVIDSRREITANMDKLPQAISKHLEEVWKLLDSIWSIDSHSQVTSEAIDRTKLAIDHLSLALFDLDHSNLFFSNAKILRIQDRWALHWLNSEGMSELFKRLQDYDADNSKQAGYLAIKLYKDTIPAILEHISFLIEDIKAEKFGGMLSRSTSHSVDEYKLFENFRIKHYSIKSRDHFDYIRGLTDYLEVRFRQFMYFSMVSQHGNNPLDKFPESDRAYAYKNVSAKKSFSLCRNPFDGFTRSQFRKAFTDGGIFRDTVVASLDTNWTKGDWDTFFSMFADINIEVAHLQYSSFDSSLKPKYLEYAKLSERLITQINDCVSNFFTRIPFLLVEPGKESSVNHTFFVYSFRGPKVGSGISPGKVVGTDISFLPKPHSVENALAEATYNKVSNYIIALLQSSEDRTLIVDLLDIDFIYSYFDVSLVDFLSSLSFAYFIRGKILIHPWFGSSICITLTN